MKHSDGARHLDDDRGIDLLNGLLGADQESRLVEHMRGCPACERRFQALAGTHERGRARAHELALHTPRRLASPGGVRALRVQRWWPVGLGLAAAAAVLWLFTPQLTGRHGLFTRGPLAPGTLAPTELTAPWLPEPVADITLRSDIARLDDSLRAGLAAYERRDLPTALSLLRRPLPAGTADQVRRLYLADLEVRAARPAAALAALDTVWLEEVPEPWRGEGLWTRLRAYSDLGMRAEADSLARELAGETGPIAERARKALRPRSR